MTKENGKAISILSNTELHLFRLVRNEAKKVGFSGSLLVPVRDNTSSQIIRIYPGERFCQIILENLASPVVKPAGRYQRKDITIGVLKERSRLEQSLICQGKITLLKSKFSLSH